MKTMASTNNDNHVGQGDDPSREIITDGDSLSGLLDTSGRSRKRDREGAHSWQRPERMTRTSMEIYDSQDLDVTAHSDVAGQTSLENTSTSSNQYSPPYTTQYGDSEKDFSQDPHPAGIHSIYKITGSLTNLTESSSSSGQARDHALLKEASTTRVPPSSYNNIEGGEIRLDTHGHNDGEDSDAAFLDRVGNYLVKEDAHQKERKTLKPALRHRPKEEFRSVVESEVSMSAARAVGKTVKVTQGNLSSEEPPSTVLEGSLRDTAYSNSEDDSTSNLRHGVRGSSAGASKPFVSAFPKAHYGRRVPDVSGAAIIPEIGSNPWAKKLPKNGPSTERGGDSDSERGGDSSSERGGGSPVRDPWTEHFASFPHFNKGEVKSLEKLRQKSTKSINAVLDSPAYVKNGVQLEDARSRLTEATHDYMGEKLIERDSSVNQQEQLQEIQHDLDTQLAELSLDLPGPLLKAQKAVIRLERQAQQKIQKVPRQYSEIAQELGRSSGDVATFLTLKEEQREDCGPPVKQSFCLCNTTDWPKEKNFAGSNVISCNNCDEHYHWQCIGMTEEFAIANADHWVCDLCVVRTSASTTEGGFYGEQLDEEDDLDPIQSQQKKFRRLRGVRAKQLNVDPERHNDENYDEHFSSYRAHTLGTSRYIHDMEDEGRLGLHLP